MVVKYLSSCVLRKKSVKYENSCGQSRKVLTKLNNRKKTQQKDYEMMLNI